MLRPMRTRVESKAAAGLIALSLVGCAGAPGPYARLEREERTPRFQSIGFATWRDDEPAYRLYPGDVIDVSIPSAPELNRSATVQPDGRISLPLIAPVMAADLSVLQLQGVLSQAYAGQLLRPVVEVAVKQAQPLRVFVGGEVEKAGVYDMPGDIDALQAVIMAGGLRTTAESRRIVLIRRGTGGRPMRRVIDLSPAALASGRADAVALRRFDILYAPRSGIADLDLFVDQHLRQLLPIQFSYAINGSTYANTR